MLRLRAWASVRTIKVLARPGTPTSRQWPRAKMAISSCSSTCFWPTMVLLSSPMIWR